jgi:hypothetical protein
MTKVKLCYTAENADSDWLIDSFTMDEFNYKDKINRYVKENIEDAKQLSNKWELDGNPDPLYLNFRMDRSNPILFRLIDNYMDCFD